MRKCVIVSICLVIFCSLFNVLPVQAAPDDWQEIRTDFFTILYRGKNRDLAYSIQINLGTEMDQIFTGFSGLFPQAITPPITIRLYNNLDEFISLNPAAPSLAETQTHSRIGSREIALLCDRVILGNNLWKNEIRNALRYELIILFAKETGKTAAPAGLLSALGFYAQNPQETLAKPENLGLPQGATLDVLDENFSLRNLWQHPSLEQDTLKLAQTSISVAYLLDAYGWQNFITFLQLLPNMADLSAALESAYQLDFTRLESAYKAYLPLYLSERWQYNFFYNVDVARYAALINAGAYQDALDGITAEQLWLPHLNQPENQRQLEALLLQAQQGQQAENLATQGWQALLNDAFPQALDAFSQASAIFAELGNLTRQAEMDQYIEQAGMIVQLREKAAQIYAQKITVFSHFNPLIRSLSEIEQGMTETGDVNGAHQAAAYRNTLITQRNIRLIVISSVLVLAGSALAFWLAKRKPAIEADL